MLEVQHLRKSFGSVVAVDDVSFTLRKGEQATKVVPVRWAVDGLDAMTWRGLGISGALGPILVLLGFSAIFGAVAVARFRWEET